MDNQDKKILNRLKRIEGQVKGLQSMIMENRSCEEVLTQLAAVRSALDEVGIQIISQRMRECLKENELDTESAVELALEVFLKYARYVK